MSRVAPLVVLLALLPGCAPRRAPQQSVDSSAPAATAPRRIAGGDVVVRRRLDPVVGLSVYDAVDLFERGIAELEAGNSVLARVLFARLLAEFPSSPQGVPARHNLALAAERVGQVEDAAQFYEEYAQVVQVAEPSEAASIRLHAGVLLFEAERFEAAVLPLGRALAAQLLDRTDDWLARALLARVRGRMGGFELAEAELSRIRREIRRANQTAGEAYPWSSAMVWFHAAELHRDHAQRQRLLDVDDLAAARVWLDESAALFLEARRCHKRVLEHRHPDWAGRAALALGAINVDFRAVMLGADTPSGLDEQTLAVYRDLLLEQTQSFLGKAVRDYRWLVDDAVDLRIAPADVARLRSALAELEARLLD